MLPKNEKQFHLSIVGEVTGTNYEGQFTCVCVPTVAQRNAILRHENREAGDMENIPNELFIRARWLANAQGRLIDWPEWWQGSRQGGSLIDDNVLKAVYDKCIEAEIEWRTQVKTKAAQAVATQTPSQPTPQPST